MTSEPGTLPYRYGVELPEWLRRKMDALPSHVPDPVERMQLVNRFAAQNIRHGTGGPFAALVVDGESGRLVSVGVNLVLDSGIAGAHAEVVGLSLAQAAAGTWNLPEVLTSTTLVGNAQPCAMCMGALLWSGIRTLEFAVTSEDVERISGFDEGPVPADWRHQLARRGISVDVGVQEEEGIQVFREYRALVDSQQLPLYNGT